MSKPWGGGIGAWAADAERADAEEAERQAATAAAIPAEPLSFPSLKEATAAKPKKKKATMSLSEFYAGPAAGGYRSEPSRLTPDEMLRLPTGPKERAPDEAGFGRLGGGFRSYGRTDPPPRRQDYSDGPRRSYGGGFEEERRGAPPSRVSDYDLPSRADEVDNWAAGKKPVSVTRPDSARYDRDRYASLGAGPGAGGGSRADDLDNWTAGKKTTAPSRSTFGSGFRDPGGDRERPKLLLDKPRAGGVSGDPARSSRPSPFGAARPREDVLAEKGLDWRKLDTEIETRKTSRPTSSQSSRPSSPHSSRPESPALAPEGVPKLKQKVNPFGEAKPREILLQEQGKDWRKMDLELEHRGVDRPETEEEKALKEELNYLKKELEKETEVNTNDESSGKNTSLLEEIACKEKDLELLIRELDDKVRFGQRVNERPGSGAGRNAGFPERPPSQSGLSDDSRILEFTERPRSHGTGGGDVWSRGGDDRRGAAFQSGGGGRERSFLGNRDIDRSKSRERW